MRSAPRRSIYLTIWLQKLKRYAQAGAGLHLAKALARETIAGNDNEPGQKRSRAQLVASICEGKTHAPVRDLIGALANGRIDRWNAEIAHWLPQVEAQIRATSTDAKKLEGRLDDHANAEKVGQRLHRGSQ